MPRSSTSSRQGRELLIEVSRRLFLSDGYAQVSMQTIAQAAGMTKGAPYYHFASKDDLFTQVSIDILTDLVRVIDAAMATDLSFEKRIRQSMLDVVNAISGDFSRWYSDLMQMKDIVAIDEAMCDVFGSGSPIQVLTPVFERAHAAGAFSRVGPQDASTMYFVLLKSAIDHAALQRKGKALNDMDLERLIDLMVDVFFHGIT